MSRPVIDLEGSKPQQLIAIGVLKLLDQGMNIHEVIPLVQEITEQVWCGHRSEVK